MVNHAGLVNQKLSFLHKYACDLVSSDTLLTNNSSTHTDSFSVLKKDCCTVYGNCSNEHDSKEQLTSPLEVSIHPRFVDFLLNRN